MTSRDLFLDRENLCEEEEIDNDDGDGEVE